MHSQFLLSLLTLIAFIFLGCPNSDTNTCNAAVAIREATLQDLQAAFSSNQLTSTQLVHFYLDEIERLNPLLKGMIEANPDSLFLAGKADRERRSKSSPSSSLGLLHGVPVLVKDNIGTKDRLNTTAGSLALLGSVVARDAGVVTKLRKAGAVVLGKASLSEWASFRSLTAPNGWSARGGQGKVSPSRGVKTSLAIFFFIRKETSYQLSIIMLVYSIHTESLRSVCRSLWV